MLYPCDAIQDNYPIYAEINQCLQQLKPLELCFIHVLGHQDKKSDKLLTLPKRLNMDCDAQAANLPMFDNPDQLQQNPRTEASYPHLHIKGQIIICRLQAPGCHHPRHLLSISAGQIPMDDIANGLNS